MDLVRSTRFLESGGPSKDVPLYILSRARVVGKRPCEMVRYMSGVKSTMEENGKSGPPKQVF